ncbi:hypothetical protein L1S32_09235 [Methanogenium sp. S4BF]|uniref:hypothetical protein n=1 Tax=Methanogenium sp. S4BF TaxID=1789226 RepID=UPI002416DD09|nr:hypothetical protein [Methanogenium sp. S4BF]WFN34024.1 hypothetical protein L1S32_09235 [Methanogenium sp. S4BF]
MDMIDSQNSAGSDEISYQTIQPDVSYINRPTCVPEFPVVALPLGMVVGLLGAAFLLRR